MYTEKFVRMSDFTTPTARNACFFLACWPQNRPSALLFAQSLGVLGGLNRIPPALPSGRLLAELFGELGARLATYLAAPAGFPQDIAGGLFKIVRQ